MLGFEVSWRKFKEIQAQQGGEGGRREGGDKLGIQPQLPPWLTCDLGDYGITQHWPGKKVWATPSLI